MSSRISPNHHSNCLVEEYWRVVQKPKHNPAKSLKVDYWGYNRHETMSAVCDFSYSKRSRIKSNFFTRIIDFSLGFYSELFDKINNSISLQRTKTLPNVNLENSM